MPTSADLWKSLTLVDPRLAPTVRAQPLLVENVYISGSAPEFWGDRLLREMRSKWSTDRGRQAWRQRVLDTGYMPGPNAERLDG